VEKKKKPINVSIDTTEEIPEDALPETKDKKNKGESDLFANIDLTSELKPNEQLPVRTHRPSNLRSEKKEI